LCLCLCLPLAIGSSSSITNSRQPSLSRFISLHTEQIFSSFASYPKELMWSPIELISNDYPLVFFHQRKAGGSSVRIQLNDYATHR
jgi:hypothetical protein